MSTPPATLLARPRVQAPAEPLVFLPLTHVLGIPLVTWPRRCAVCGARTVLPLATVATLPAPETVCSVPCGDLLPTLREAAARESAHAAGKPAIGVQLLGELRAWLLVLYKAAQAERRMGLFPPLEDAGRALRDAERGVTSHEAHVWLQDDEDVLTSHIPLDACPGDPLRCAVGALLCAVAWALVPERTRAYRNHAARLHLERSRALVLRAASPTTDASPEKGAEV